MNAEPLFDGNNKWTRLNKWEGGVMIWAYIVSSKIIGCYKVNGVQINAVIVNS